MSETETGVKAGIEREKRITEMKLERLREKVERFEERYDMDSDEFRNTFRNGELGDDESYMQWDVYLDAIDELRESRRQLRQFNT